MTFGGPHSSEVRARHSKPEVKGSIPNTVNVSFVRLPWSLSVSLYLPHNIRLDAMERHRKPSIKNCGSAQRRLSGVAGKSPQGRNKAKKKKIFLYGL